VSSVKGVELNCVDQREMGTYWWGVHISRIVHKESEIVVEVKLFLLLSTPNSIGGASEWGCGWCGGSKYGNMHWDSFCLGREGWLRDHLWWMEIPYWNFQHHIGKGKHCGYLKGLYTRRWVKEMDLSNGLGEFLPN
jgi:hypothetical protein